MDYRLIIEFLIFDSIIYGGNIFIAWTHKCLLNDENNNVLSNSFIYHKFFSSNLVIKLFTL